MARSLWCVGVVLVVATWPSSRTRGASPEPSAVAITGSGARFAARSGARVLEFEWLGPDALRLRRVAEAASNRASPEGMLLPGRWQGARVTARSDGSIGGGAFVVRVGPRLAEVVVRMGSRSLQLRFAGTPARPALEWRLEAGERLLGLGQHRREQLDRRGATYELWNQFQPGGGTVAIPFLLSSRGYGLLWHNASRTVVDLGNSVPDRGSFRPLGGELDLVLFAGPGPKEVLAQLGRACGRPPMPPLWALGYQQSRYGYASERQAREIVAEFRRRKLPLDTLVLDLDWFGGQEQLGALRFDRRPGRFPTPEKMIAAFQNVGVRTVVINEPYVRPDVAPYRELDRLRYFGRDRGGKTLLLVGPWNLQLALLDFTSPGARRHVWERLVAPLLAAGVAGFWIDLGEPEVHPPEMQHAGGPAAQVHNRYNASWAQAYYEGQRKTHGDRRVYLLARSAAAGMARFGAGVWTGDTAPRFDTLRWHFSEGQQMGLGGPPYWGSDIGGFYKHAPRLDGPLYARWFQLGALSPNFRAHGDHQPREPWGFGPRVLRLARRFLALRYRLLPYLYALARQAHERGLPYLRPVALEFPDEAGAFTFDDAFLLGPSLLAFPVAGADRARRAIRLPSGHWYDYATGARHEGPTLLHERVPLERLPLFVRGGTLLLEGEERHSTGEARWTRLTAHLYPAAAATASYEAELYEDDGTSYAYERGEYAKTPFSVSQAPGELRVTLRPGSGRFPERPLSRRLELVVYGRPRPLAVLRDGGSLPRSAVRRGARGGWAIALGEVGQDAEVLLCFSR
ncbi:MAG: glycoside hydrolase family 31 protein [Deltaproteobacteria bacterium]|nr:glycoside hydrolase family 31 protein [Deltaproteobacteria bacterium]